MKFNEFTVAARSLARPYTTIVVATAFALGLFCDWVDVAKLTIAAGLIGYHAHLRTKDKATAEKASVQHAAITAGVEAPADTAIKA